jgi:hypothetical protein
MPPKSVQTPLSLQGLLVAQVSLVCSQYAPLRPLAHTQLTRPEVSLQVPFPAQVLGLQSSSSAQVPSPSLW